MHSRSSYIFFCLLIAGCCLLTFSLKAQQLKLGNNPASINKSAVLELESWNQGLRLTRVDTSAVNAIIETLSLAEQDSTNGMIVFQMSDSSIYYRAGGHWRKLAVEGNVANAPVYYNSSGDVLNPPVTKILTDSITGNSVAEIREIDLPAGLFTQIISIQLTGKINDGQNPPSNQYSIIPSVISYTNSKIKIRILELKIGGSGLLGNIGDLLGKPFQVPSKESGILGIGSVIDNRPYTIYYRIEGY